MIDIVLTNLGTGQQKNETFKINSELKNKIKKLVENSEYNSYEIEGIPHDSDLTSQQISILTDVYNNIPYISFPDVPELEIKEND